MSLIKKRVADLEAKSPTETWTGHRVVVQPGEKLDAVLDRYGRDQIAPQDHLVVRTVVAAPLISAVYGERP